MAENTLKRRLESIDPLPVPKPRNNLDNMSNMRLEGNSGGPTTCSNKGQGSIYSMDCDKFIREIRARPGIWEINHPNYKNKHKVKALWYEIHLQFPNISVDDLKKRYKNLKDSYRKELKRLQIHISNGDTEKAKTTWRYFDSFHFLKDQLSNLTQNENTDSNGPPSTYQETSSHSPTSPGSSKSEEDEDDEREMPSTTKLSDTDVKAELLKMERKKMLILEEEIARSNQLMYSDNYHFLMSLLPEMNKLGPLQKMRLRTKISQAVLDEVSLCAYENDKAIAGAELQASNEYEELKDDGTLEQDIKEEIINMYD